MSNAYAERYKILPVRVTTAEAVIATCEPYVREWEAELGRILRLEIKRVIANPQDINGFLVEFYNLARSVKSASELHGAALSDITKARRMLFFIAKARYGGVDALAKALAYADQDGPLALPFAR